MKNKLIKQLRRNVALKYEIRPFRDKYKIYTGPRTMMLEDYNTIEDAKDAFWKLWHIEAENYLWKHRSERKKINKMFK